MTVKISKKNPYLRSSSQIFCDGVRYCGFSDLIEEDPNDLKVITNRRVIRRRIEVITSIFYHFSS